MGEKRSRGGVFGEALKYISMLPLVGKLGSEERGYKSASDWRGSFVQPEYKPSGLRDLPSGGDKRVDRDATHLGDYHYYLGQGRDPEKELGLPSAKTWDQKPITPGQSAPSWGGGRHKESVGQVGAPPRHRWEAGMYDRFAGPLFKYQPKKAQTSIRKYLKDWGTPYISSAPLEEEDIPTETEDHANIRDKSKKKIEQALETILTARRRY